MAEKEKRGGAGRFFRRYLMLSGAVATIYVLIRALVALAVYLQALGM